MIISTSALSQNRGRSVREPAALAATISLGLPKQVRACLFDLDGVLTDTARTHAEAWKEVFDGFLKVRGRATGTTFVAFDAVGDYDSYVDGRTRADGTRSFLRSRGVDVPEGGADDGAGALTIIGLGDAANAIWMRMLRHDGVTPYPGSVHYVHAVRSAGLHTAVVSSGANCAEVLHAAGIADLFETRIDGVDATGQHLLVKPGPETFLAAAKMLGVEPGEAAVFEDAPAGVADGRAEGFGWVVGVDRVGRAEELLACGADRVVTDLAQLLRIPRLEPA